MADLRSQIPLAVLAVAIAASVAGGVFLLVRATGPGGGMQIFLPTATAAPRVEIKVSIAGAIRSPGVYEVAESSRLVDVVEAAGGFTDDADQDAIHLASRVFDEQHFRVPRLGEAVQDTPTQPPPEAASGASGKIDLNSAAVEALIALPNIGDVKARAIVSYREVNGPFSDVEAVLGVAGIGSATLAAIRDLVEVR